jgi:hypothetical protein
MPQNYSPNHDVRDSQMRLVSPRINVSLFPTTVIVGTSAVLLPSITRSNRTFILVQNQSPNPIALGDSSVTSPTQVNNMWTSNGYILLPQSDITIPCTDQAVVYAISNSSGNNVSVLEGV